MVCATSCVIAFIFIIANIYCCSGNSQTIQEYVGHLSPENKQRYELITKELMGIYFMGLLLGFILSMIVVVSCKKYFTDSRGRMLCMIAAITFSVNYFYYILSPKSDWMVLHLKSGEETKAWLDVYRSMQYRYHIGLILGILAVVAFGNAMC